MKTNYVLIDFENILPDNLELLDQEWIRVLLFVGQNQRKLPFPIVRAMQKMGERAQYVEMAGVGHNALDFHIAYYIGRISESDKDAYFHMTFSGNSTNGSWILKAGEWTKIVMLHDVHQNLRRLLEEVRVRLLPLAQRTVGLLGIFNRVNHRLSK